MPYFFILPGFAFYVASLVALILASGVVEGLRPHRSTIAGVLGWSSLGFLLANLLYVVIAISLIDKIPMFSGAANALSIGAGIGLIFVLPFVFSAAGLIGGAVLGLRRGRHDKGTA